KSQIRNQLRRSFTLIELMIVVTIIAILATITLGVVGGLLSQAREAATKATILKIQGLLNSRAQAFDRLLKRKGYLVGTYEYQSLQQNYPWIVQTTTKNTLATKLLHARFFPQYYSEIYDQYSYAKPQGGTVPQIYANPGASNSEILYQFLTQ